MAGRIRINQHAPIVKLHPDEIFFPIGFEWWLKNTRLLPVNPDYPNFVRGRSFPTDENGNELPRDFAPLAPTQGVYYEFETYGGWTIIVYYMFFAFNGSKRVAGLAPTGAHSADIEAFHAVFMPSGELGFYALTSHKDVHLYNVNPKVKALVPEHAAFQSNEVLDTKNGRPVIYSALDAHALYGRVGSFFRFFGFGNDNTGDGPEVEFFWEDARSTNPNVLDYRHGWGLTRTSDNKFRGSVLRLLSTARGPFGRRDDWKSFYIRKGKPLPFYLSRTSVMWLGYLLFLFVPALLVVWMRRSGRISTKRNLGLLFVGTFFTQMYLLKGIFYFFGQRLGLPQDGEAVSGYLWPIRFRGAVI